MFQGHGDDGYLHHQPVKADFSTNVWHGGAPEGLKEYLFASWEKVQRYPEVLAESLTAKISSHYNFPATHFLVTNGTTESIYLIAQALKNKNSAIVIPAFAEYEDACRINEHELSFIQWDDLKSGSFPAADLLFICNPNNPTGAVFQDLEALIKEHVNTIFVIDEAFIEFTFSIDTVIPLVKCYSNLIVLRSMTKVYAIPGLRLGYIIAQPALINILRKFKLPWAVNVMALEAGNFIFDNMPGLQIPIKQLLADKAEFTARLENSILSVYPGSTHFFLAETRSGTAAALKNFLLEEFNLLIRDAGNFRGLRHTHIRLATLSPEKNQLLINALSEWIPT